jgi:hypothetical protein
MQKQSTIYRGLVVQRLNKRREYDMRTIRRSSLTFAATHDDLMKNKAAVRPGVREYVRSEDTVATESGKRLLENPKHLKE